MRQSTYGRVKRVGNIVLSPAESRSKRLMDIVGAGLLLIVTLPITIPVAAVIAMRLGRPILFRQERHGLHGRPFTIYKFRTMVEATDDQGCPLSDTQRITRIGSILRATSIDELPELLNVLNGTMSLVGPRPLLARYTPFFTPAEKLRFLARPGITGLAQIRGRNAATWDERLRHDIQYVQSWSLRLDLSVLGKTFLAVLRRDGVHVTPTTHLRDLDDERRAWRSDYQTR